VFLRYNSYHKRKSMGLRLMVAVAALNTILFTFIESFLGSRGLDVAVRDTTLLGRAVQGLHAERDPLNHSPFFSNRAREVLFESSFVAHGKSPRGITVISAPSRMWRSVAR